MPKEELQLVPYDLEIATIEALKAKYMDITIPPEDKAAYAMVMSGLRECREIRLSVDAWHKGRKALIVKAGKHYDGEKNRVHGLVEPIEEHLKAVRKVEDDRVEAIQAEKIRLEQERVAGIRAKIDGLHTLAAIRHTMTAAEITDRMDGVADIIIDDATYMEFREEAEKVRDETWHTLEVLEKERSEWEETQAKAKAEAERLEKVRNEQEAQEAKLKAAQDKIDKEARKVAAEKAALEAEKRAEEQRKRQEEFEKQALENARIKAEKDAKEKAEREAREAKEKAEAEAAEKARAEALLPDKEKLIEWVKWFNDSNVPIPKLENDASRAIYNVAMDGIEVILRRVEEEAEAL